MPCRFLRSPSALPAHQKINILQSSPTCGSFSPHPACVNLVSFIISPAALMDAIKIPGVTMPKRQDSLSVSSPTHRPASALSLRSSPFAMDKDKHGEDIVNVGEVKFGFDSRVPIDALRSLYLKPHYVTTSGDATPEVGATHQQFIPEDLADYASKSIFHPKDNTISYTTLSRFPPVKLIPHAEQKRILITGGAGFVGSHLVDRLMLLGHTVTVLDNFFTGSKTNTSHWVGHPNFELVRHDIVESYMTECDRESLQAVLEVASLVLTMPSSGGCRDLSPGMPRLTSSLSVQRRQDAQDFLHGHSQHAGSCEENQGALPHYLDLRWVPPSLSLCQLCHLHSRTLQRSTVIRRFILNLRTSECSPFPFTGYALTSTEIKLGTRQPYRPSCLLR